MAEIKMWREYSDYYNAEIKFASRVSDLKDFLLLNYPNQIQLKDDETIELLLIESYGVEINLEVPIIRKNAFNNEIKTTKKIKVEISLGCGEERVKAKQDELVFWEMECDQNFSHEEDRTLRSLIIAMNEFNESLMDFYTRENILK
jgi:hypothetical protein